MSLSLGPELARHLDEVVVPPADLAAIIRQARSRRRRRLVALVAAASAVIVAGLVLSQQHVGVRRGDRGIDPIGRLDLAPGLRAFANPGERIWVGGRSVPFENDYAWMDTDAVATSYGIVYFPDGRPTLLGASGTSRPLVDQPPDLPVADFHPSAVFDPATPLVAWTEPAEAGVLVRVFDLESHETVASRLVRCRGSDCTAVRVGGLDSGIVLVMSREESVAWDIRSDELLVVGDSDLKVADARSRVLLYDARGSAPSRLPEGWRAVAGPIDASLSFDGTHLLSWSSTLEPTRPTGTRVVLDQGPVDGKGAAWWAFDTDGTVLVADANDYPHTVVYDCPLSGDRCERIAQMEVTGGDPMFIGADM